MSSAILTASGKWFDVLHPDPALIDLRDIAAALSKLCRFGGHCAQFYSVAEHSVLTARLTQLKHPKNRILSAWALLHDASEAYLVDIPRPIKRQLQEYVRLEDAIQCVIAERFALPWPMPKEVHVADGDMLSMELRAYMPAQPENMLPPLPEKRPHNFLPDKTLSADRAEETFFTEARNHGLG